MIHIYISGNLFSWNLGTAAMAFALMEQFKNKNYYFFKASVDLNNDKRNFSEITKQKRLSIIGFNKRFLPMSIASPLTLFFCIPYLIKSEIVLEIPGEIPKDFNLWSQFSRYLLAKLFRKKFVICGCSLGPFKNRLTKKIAAHMYKNVDALLIREPATLKYIENLGVKNSILTSDNAYLLQIYNTKKIIQFKQDVGNFIGITLKHKYFYQCVDYKDQIGKLIVYITKVLKKKVIIIPHGKEDVLPSEIIYKENENKKLFLLEGDFLPQELKWLISQSDFFIGSRIHACIAALSTGVPTLVYIPYSDHRSVGFMSEFGLQNVVVDPFSGKDLVFEFKKNYKIKDEMAIIISKKLPEIKKKLN